SSTRHVPRVAVRFSSDKGDTDARIHSPIGRPDAAYPPASPERRLAGRGLCQSRVDEPRRQRQGSRRHRHDHRGRAARPAAAGRPNQFTNLANPDIHYRTTGREIWEQSDGRITVFVAGVGTGGTLSGVARYLKEQNPDIKIIGADPEGSVLSGDKPHPWKVEGIGEDFVPKTLNSQFVDEWIRIGDAESFQTARALARREG